MKVSNEARKLIMKNNYTYVSKIVSKGMRREEKQDKIKYFQVLKSKINFLKI